MRAGRVTLLAGLLGALVGCGSDERGAPQAPPSGASVTRASPASSLGEMGAGAARIVLPITPIEAKVASFPATDVVGARLGPKGWYWGTSPDARHYEVQWAPNAAAKTPAGTVKAPRPGVPRLVATPTRSFAWFEANEDAKLGEELFTFEPGRLDRIDGASPGEWALDLTEGRTLFIGTPGGKMMTTTRWQASVLAKGGSTVVASATAPETAWGAVALGDGFVVAVREPITMAGATSDQKVAAILGVLDGDGRAASALAEPARGALVHLDRDGRETGREWIGPQRPEGLASTPAGWLVVLGEGTLKNGLRDAVLVARGPKETAFRVLAADLDTPTGLRARGAWSCLTEMPSRFRGEAYVLHCFDPERGLHVATAPIEGMVFIDDLEPGPPTRVWLSRHRFQGKPEDEVLSVDLP